jgi:hypothetical protein
MSSIYKNITGNTATDLDIYDEKFVMYISMMLCNIHSSDSVTVDLYITRTSDGELPPNDKDDTRTFVGENGNWDPLPTTRFDYHILKNMVIPKGATLKLDNNDLFFDNTLYDLYIKLSASDSAVDVILYRLN